MENAVTGRPPACTVIRVKLNLHPGNTRLSSILHTVVGRPASDTVIIKYSVAYGAVEIISEMGFCLPIITVSGSFRGIINITIEVTRHLPESSGGPGRSRIIATKCATAIGDFDGIAVAGWNTGKFKDTVIGRRDRNGAYDIPAPILENHDDITNAVLAIISSVVIGIKPDPIPDGGSGTAVIETKISIKIDFSCGHVLVVSNGVTAADSGGWCPAAESRLAVVHHNKIVLCSRGGHTGSKITAVIGCNHTGWCLAVVSCRLKKAVTINIFPDFNGNATQSNLTTIRLPVRIRIAPYQITERGSAGRELVTDISTAILIIRLKIKIIGAIIGPAVGGLGQA